MNDRFIHFLLFGDVFANGDHMGHLGVIYPHWNLAYFPGLLLPLEPRLLLHVNNFPGPKDIAELDFQLATRLASEHLKYVAAKHVLAIDPDRKSTRLNSSHR